MTDNPFAVPEPGATPPPPPPPGYGPPPSAPPPGYPDAPTYGAPAGHGPPASWAAPPTDQMPYGVLASPGRRLGGFFLNIGLAIVTLVVGYLVWALILWGQGTNPGKKMLGMKMVSTIDGHTLTWGQMCLRNFVLGGLLLGVLNTLTFSAAYVLDGVFVLFGTKQRLIDKIGNTQVVMA